MSENNQVERRPWKHHRFQVAILVLAPIACAASALSSGGSEPTGSPVVFKESPRSNRRNGSEADGDGDETPSWLVICTDEKLQRLIDLDVTSAEIALAAGSSLRAVEERRRSLRAGKTKQRAAKLDDGIDALFSIFTLLERHQIEPTNIRAWLIGRSEFLEEQRPAVLLSANEFELVRDAAIAYASNEAPAEFLASRGPLPRPAEPAGV